MYVRMCEREGGREREGGGERERVQLQIELKY
jgi:hypothetical protein